MSSSTSAWVCTKTSLAPTAAAANSSDTRALRYFCCVAVTKSTSQLGNIFLSRARLLSVSRLWPSRGDSSVVSGSGQSTSTRSRSTGRSRTINSTAPGSIPSISGVMSPRRMSVGRVVVGRSAPVSTVSAPKSALIKALFPVPVPPNKATTKGASSARAMFRCGAESADHRPAGLGRLPIGRSPGPAIKAQAGRRARTAVPFGPVRRQA